MSAPHLLSFVVLLFACLWPSVDCRAQVHLAHDPPWQGHWIWGPPSDAPPVAIDLGQWLATHRGGWDEPLVRRLLGNVAAVGVTEVYWMMADRHGRRLYPSSDRQRVLVWRNWGVDFGATDMPAIALQLAQRLHLDMALVADASTIDEVRSRYPDAVVVAPDAVPAEALPGVEVTRDAVAGLARRYQNADDQFFRKRFPVPADAVRGELTIAAMQLYRVYLDGKLIGSDSTWQEGETYNVASRLTAGEHVLAVEVAGPGVPAWEVGVVVNLRWIDGHGDEHLVVTGPEWRRSSERKADWMRPGFDDEHWHASTVVAIDGIANRFQPLGEPWTNHRPTLSTDAHDDVLIRGVEAVCDTTGDQLEMLFDRSISDVFGRRWTTPQLPASVTIRLPEAEMVAGLRLYSGWLRNDYALAGAGEIRHYQVQARVNDRWVDVTPPRQASPYRREYPTSTFHEMVRFRRPVTTRQIRLHIIDAYSTQLPDGHPDVQAAERSKACHFREVELLRVVR